MVLNLIPLLLPRVQHKKPFQLAEIAWTILLLYLNLLVQETTSIQLRAFVVRVWIEGESKFCNDATANQDWTIQLDFQAKDNAGN